MFKAIKIKEWINWPLIRTYLCTVAITLSFNTTWRMPREAARFGGLQYALASTAALLAVALPLTQFQLAVGQLSQQDAVGLWRAVPIFKGVGYLRLLVSFLGSIYASIHLALTTAYFLYTLKNSIPFIDCIDFALPMGDDGYNVVFNSSQCFDITFMSPLKENSEYFIALCLIILFAWICLPFLLYSPVKLMKQIFYIFGPLVIVLSIATVSGIADSGRLQWIVKREDWRNYLQPHIWFGAVTQALLTSEAAGGYLISAGDSIYSNSDVRWIAISLIITSIIVNWVGIIFWYSISGSSVMDVSSTAVLAQIYDVAVESDTSVVWSLIAFAVLFLSGVITMLVRLYPIYDRIRRVGGVRWRITCAGSAVVCAGASIATLAGRWNALMILEAYSVPMLASGATVLEVFAFLFIYGWKVLMEDIEFLTGDPLRKTWIWGLCLAPVVLLLFVTWWAVEEGRGSWQLPPWPPAVMAATGALALIIFITFAVSTITKQVQYDIIGKLKSSFKPSRHWGPRDPITHYYWLTRREEAQRGNPSDSRYRRRHLGQLTGTLISSPISHIKNVSNEVKRRSNSDDWIYTIYRRKGLEEMFPDPAVKKVRSQSLDWAIDVRLKRNSTVTKIMSPLESVESVKEDAWI